MNETLNLKVGITIALVSVSTIILIGGLELSGLVVSLCFFGWLGIKLYGIKVNTWLGLLLINLPLNLMFNPFFLLLLLKSWALLKYKAQFEELDGKLQKIL